MSTRSHLTEDERCTIAAMLDNRQSFSKIGNTIGKSPTTVSREVRAHAVWRKTGCLGQPYNSCKKRFTCKREKLRSCETLYRKTYCRGCRFCNSCCPEFEKQSCDRLSRPPYVCNGCNIKFRCTLEKHLYLPQEAQSQYRTLLSESRTGIALSPSELSLLDQTVSPLIRKNQSIHHVYVHNRDSVLCSERTIYRYVDQSVLSVKNLDLPRKVRFRKRKTPRILKVDKRCRIGRTYADYLAFLKDHPSMSVVELDSVEGIIGGKVLLTLHFVRSEFMLAFLRDHNDSQSVIDIFNSLYRILGTDTFLKLFPLCLADNGSEFSNPLALEFGPDNERRTRIFYCDPQAPQQKGSAERNHEFIRCFIPKGTDIGLYSEQQIALMMDHINSYSRKGLGDKTPLELFSFLYGEKIPELFGCHALPPQDVTLSSSVFKEVPHEI